VAELGELCHVSEFVQSDNDIVIFEYPARLRSWRIKYRTLGLSIRAQDQKNRKMWPLAGRGLCCPRRGTKVPDGADSGDGCDRFCRQCGDSGPESTGGWTIEIVKRSDAAKGFVLLPRRWVVERTFAWLNRNGRLAKDVEETIESAATGIYIASVKLMSRRLATTRTP
jgi:hypothetical protein